MPAAKKPESNVDKAVAYIARHPGARSPELAEHLGIPQTNVHPTLAPLVNAGYLIVCKVERPGKSPVNEYRLSAAVAEDKVSWTEFRISKRAGLPLTKAPGRLPRNAAPTATTAAPKADAPPVAPATAAMTKPPAGETKSVATGCSEYPTKPAATVTTAVQRAKPAALPQPIRVAPRIVFMVDSTGQLRIEIPDHPPIVCSREETNDAGLLLITTEPVWSNAA